MNEFFKAVRDFITNYLPKQKCCSSHTIRSYKMTLNLLVTFLREKKHLSLKDINFDILNREVIFSFLEWLEVERKCSAVSRNVRLAALRSFFNHAGLIDCVNAELSLIVAKIPIKRQPSKMVDFLSEAALETLLKQPNLSEKVGLRNGFFMMLMYDTAARCDELLRLRLCDMQAEGKQPVVYLTGKGSKTRVVPLMPRTVEHYRRYLSCFHKDACMTDTDFIFYTVIHHKRNAMSPDTPAIFMRQYGNSARLECREFPARMHPHVLRHTRAIHLYRNGVPLELLSQFLGHSSVETTRIYAFADTEMKRKAIEKADKFLQISKSSDFPIWKDDEEMILKLSGLK